MDLKTKEAKNNGNHDIQNGETKTAEEIDITEFEIEEDGKNKNCKGSSLENKGTLLNFRVMWNKTKYDIDNLGTLNTVADLRRRIEQLTGQRHSFFFVILMEQGLYFFVADVVKLCKLVVDR